MQEEKSKILSKIVGELILDARKSAGITFTDFCYGNDIKKGTYERVIKGKTQVSLYNVSKMIKALGWNFQKFGEELDKQLPKEFWEYED
ncbi:MAG: helix-turn-helix domain-containing protein [Candidatus Gastranaerophilales bacterium]|nr:helix-turn-helix domain-containing protein [Candidatus Gastranaerophilales bacterium]MCM1073252.1 helix-turn-helix domain-containing protein [Bacteroides sp.]